MGAPNEGTRVLIVLTNLPLLFFHFVPIPILWAEKTEGVSAQDIPNRRICYLSAVDSFTTFFCANKMQTNSSKLV